jgi:hypothetical protein
MGSGECETRVAPGKSRHGERAALTTKSSDEPEGTGHGEPAKRKLTPAAERALAEAAARRAAAEAATSDTAKEVGGRDGPDPARYGDWEKGGIVSDF